MILQVLLPAGLALAGMVAAMAAIRALASARGWPAEVQRKAIHVGAGLVALSFPWVFPSEAAFWLFMAAALVLLLFLRHARAARGAAPGVATGLAAGLGSAVHGVNRDSWGELFLPLSIALLWVFHDDAPIRYVLPLAILALADAAAALTGTAYGRHRFTVETGHKTIEGSVMFFLVTVLVAMVGLLLLSEVSRVSVIVIAVALAAFATLVEVDSWRGFDNLFLPMGALIFLDATMGDAPATVAATTALFLSALFVMGALGRRLGFSAHDVRVTGIAFFLILSVTMPWNAILPAALLVAQLVAGRSEERFGGLDVIAALAILGFGFLAAGDLTGRNGIAFFGLAVAGVTLLQLGHAGRGLSRLRRLALTGAGAVLLWAIWSAVQTLNAAQMAWAPALPLAAALTFGALAIPGALRPEPVARTARRAAAIGAAPAVLLYAAFVALS